ncbi:MAG: type VI secretion system contractile sheath small subunit [Thiohalomonas sp.]|nr:type VI secretion system contractile sheath small subunit [Thiohalomonas sp.]
MGIDIDNFDAVMSRIVPELHWQSGSALEAPKSIEFRQNDDFHPDSLYQKVEIFQQFL